MPRPYECVRRAWHSDRHQPIRGSIIHEIFRIANEIHSPVTKKNKEWQQKLPIVVLKAEEILYSKANSEGEYMDLKTLWDRANDAINTIIRRDESSEETGEFLQPCIEAALHLGCIPRRVSRSQRNHHPSVYLTENTNSACATEGSSKSTPSLAPHYSNLLNNECQNFVAPTNRCITSEMPFLSHQSFLPIIGSFPSKPHPVYPLYYGVYSQPIEWQPNLESPPTLNSVGCKDPPEMGIQSWSSMRDLSKVPHNAPNEECDLSLRLGLNYSQEKINVVCKQLEPNERLSFGTGDATLDFGSRITTRKAGEQMLNQPNSWLLNHMPAYSNLATRTPGL